MHIEWQTILTAMGIMGGIFSVFLYFKNPQTASEKDQIRMWSYLEKLNADLVNLRDNHIHTIDAKLDGHAKLISNIEIALERLSTIIQERIPRKHVE